MRFAVEQAFERASRTKGGLWSRKSAMRVMLDYFASSITGTSIGFSGRNSTIVSNGFPLE